MKRKLLSAFLALVMVLSLAPFSALAADVTASSPTELATVLGADAPAAGTDTVVLKDNAKVSGNLRIACDATIDLAGHKLDVGNDYVRVDTGKKVELKSTAANGTIASTSGTAAIIAMRGSNLTVGGVTIQNSSGYGVMLNPTPGETKTTVALNGTKIDAGEGGVIVHGNLQSGAVPDLVINGATITAQNAEGAGLYLAGLANTTVTGGKISGAIGIGIKSGKLTLNGNTNIAGTGTYHDLTSNGNGINTDGSALLIEDHSSYAGNVAVTIDGATLTSTNGHAIREFKGDGNTGKDVKPKIKITSGILKSAAGKETIKTDSTDAWAAQTVTPRITGAEDGVPNVDYGAAYTKAGLSLGAQAADGSYTLTIDKARLEAVAAAGKDNETYKVLENASNPGQLWFGMEYRAPEAVRGDVASASVDFGDGKGFVSVALDPEVNKGFYNYIKVHDGSKIVTTGETAVIQWLSLDDVVMAVTRASVKVQPQDRQEYTITFHANGGVNSAASVRTVNGKLTLPAEPTREGCKFDGWFTAAEGGDPVTADTVFTADATIYAHWTPDPSAATYTVTFDSNGGSSVASQTIKSGGKVTKPSDPTRSGYTFQGWYKESGCTNAWNFTNDTVTANATLYAKWTRDDSSSGEKEYQVYASSSRHGSISGLGWYEEGDRVTLRVEPDTNYKLSWIEAERDSNGRSLDLDRSGSRYTFTMPASDVAIDASFVLQNTHVVFDQAPAAPSVFIPTFRLTTQYAPRPSVAFPDIPWESWAYQPAQWAYQNGYLDLTADGTFQLDGAVSHRQMWAIMAQWMGQSFTSDQEIVSWAHRNGAASGDLPDSWMTRNSLVVYLYKCYFLMGGDTSSTGNLIAYADSRLIASDMGRKAWTWAVEQGIIEGTTEGYLNPNYLVSRGEFAAILMRLCQK